MDTEIERESRKAYLQSEIIRSTLYAQIQIASVNSGAVNLRKIYCGDNELTPEQKAEAALSNRRTLATLATYS